LNDHNIEKFYVALTGNSEDLIGEYCSIEDVSNILKETGLKPMRTSELFGDYIKQNNYPYTTKRRGGEGERDDIIDMLNIVLMIFDFNDKDCYSENSEVDWCFPGDIFGACWYVVNHILSGYLERFGHRSSCRKLVAYYMQKENYNKLIDIWANAVPANGGKRTFSG
jgi:hypothetical protein